jgi:hypothetical protein
MGLTNNDILKKIRVALKLRDDDIIRILGHVDYEITKSELGAFFRAEEHAKYMELKDQILRNFLNGLVIEKRGVMERKKPEENSAARKPKVAPSAKNPAVKSNRKPFAGEAGKKIERKKRPRIE